MATDNFNSAGQLNQLEHDPVNHAKRVDNYVWNESAGAWERMLQSSGSGISATDIFAQSILGTRNNQIEIDYSATDPDAVSLLTVTKTNGGDATTTAGQAVYSTSTNTSGEIKAITTRNISYHPHAESYVAFSAIFTTGIANSYQRIGLYDDNNGFFIGYEGTSFGITKRSGGVDTTTTLASFNTDPLDGSATSNYTRNGVAEAVDFTKDNLYRIRFGWLGAAPIVFEVLNPDGSWVTFHTIKHPNSATVPSIQNPDLPIRLHIKKTTAGATNLTISTACWAGGTTTDLQKITSTLYDETLAKTTRSVITGQTSGGGGGYVNVKVTPSGSLTTAIGDITGIVGQNTMANSIPVTIASNQSAVPITDNGGSLTVDGIVAATKSGTWTLDANSGVDIGDVTINNASGASAVNIQDGGNSITVDGTVTANQGGTWTVQPGNTANTTAWLVTNQNFSTSTVTSVAGSATSVQLLASTSGRKAAYFYNDSTADCYLKLGTTASTSSFTVKMVSNSFYELPQPCYTGRIDAIWSSATGNIRITEIT